MYIKKLVNLVADINSLLKKNYVDLSYLTYSNFMINKQFICISYLTYNPHI